MSDVAQILERLLLLDEDHELDRHILIAELAYKKSRGLKREEYDAALMQVRRKYPQRKWDKDFPAAINKEFRRERHRSDRR